MHTLLTYLVYMLYGSTKYYSDNWSGDILLGSIINDIISWPVIYMTEVGHNL